MNPVDNTYYQLLRRVLNTGVKKSDRTGVGTLSVFGHTMEFDMSDGFPLLTSKKIYTKAVFHELLWFIKGGDNIKYLVDNNVRIWNEWPHKKYNQQNPDGQLKMDEFVDKIKNDDEFAEKWGDLGPVYGKQWVNWGGTPMTIKSVPETPHWVQGVNQLDAAIDMLKNNPDSRRIMVSAWNPGELEDQLLPPCHYAFQFWTRELTAAERAVQYAGETNIKTVECADVQDDKIANKDMHAAFDEMGVPKRALSLMFQMRSVDCFLGMPFDIASYAGLLHLVAHCVDMVPDKLTVCSGDTHIYLNHIDQVEEQLSREPFDSLPKIRINSDTKNIYDITYDDIEIVGYECHPSISAQVAV